MTTLIKFEIKFETFHYVFLLFLLRIFLKTLIAYESILHIKNDRL